MNPHHLRLAAVAILACALIAACGGGDGSSGDPTPTPQDPTAAVPAEASQSTGGLVTYLLALVAAPADDKEPVDLSAFAPVTSDNTDPGPLH